MGFLQCTVSNLLGILEGCNYFSNIHYLCPRAATLSVQSLKLDTSTDDGDVLSVDCIASHEAVVTVLTLGGLSKTLLHGDINTLKG